MEGTYIDCGRRITDSLIAEAKKTKTPPIESNTLTLINNPLAS